MFTKKYAGPAIVLTALLTTIMFVSLSKSTSTPVAVKYASAESYDNDNAESSEIEPIYIESDNC